MSRILPLLLIATPALADDPGLVRLPDDARIEAMATREFLLELVTANVVGMNCTDFRISDGEWALLTGSADRVAAVLGVKDSYAYDADFYGPAFDMLDRPDTCATEGPKVAPLIDLLRAMGGDTVLLRPLGE